ncbi:DUF1707 domain-containing protein [Amycolatopsis minnesotensis]|uniref:DUF1707 domain-containing protein n=1 Tax=Amycolatopsis minnesotensis TaxID=337894 RepID=A0ABP5D8Q1_9PSEU
MNEVPSEQLRVSDTDRESALQALGEHMSVGRLTLDEYGDRSAKVTASKTRGDLAEVFADLPAPHPVFDGAKAAGTPPPPPQQAVAEPAPAAPNSPAEWSDRPLVQRLTAAAVPVSALVAVGLFLASGAWLWFLLPVVLTMVGGGLWDQDWRDRGSARRRERHDWHREMRSSMYEARREMRDAHRQMRHHHRDWRRDFRG